MKIFIGKMFDVVWNCDTQSYKVYRNNTYIGITKFRFRDIKSYLD